MRSVVVFTDEPVVELGLRVLVQSHPEFDLVCVCRSDGEALRAAQQNQPCLFVYGLAPDANLNLLREMRRVAPQSTLVLWCREFTTELVHHAMELGARGFVSTTAAPETFRECLRSAAAGELWMEKSMTMDLLNARPVSLSRRQSQLLGLLVQGLKNKEMATALGISEGTVKAYLTTLFEKVGAKDRFELALFGLKNLRSVRHDGVHYAPPAARLVRRLVARQNARPTVE